MRPLQQRHGSRLRTTRDPFRRPRRADADALTWPGRPDQPQESSLGLPGEGDLVERLVAEALGGARDRAAAQRAIEFDGRIVVRERPDHEAAEPALSEVAPRRREQPAPESEALEFRAQVEFVDLAVVGQAARAVAPVIRVARNALLKHQQRDAAAFANRRLPPGRPAAADEFFEFRARNDAAICAAPGLIVRIRDRDGVRGLRPPNLDEGRAHARIEAKRSGSIQVLC